MAIDRPPRHRTGDRELDQRVVDLLDAAGADIDTDLLFEMLATVVRMARDGLDRLDLKISSAALREMRQAFRVFAPYRHVPKITIFGSARTRPDDPLYVQARELARALAAAGWMVVTGAGPGIMAAGAEGAGRARSIGVNIRLPFEQQANEFIAADPKLVVMKYFFTRKLMLMKESAGFVVLPGGFGTLDETFELLTLLQTGKAAPAPLVLLEVPGGTYWRAFERFVTDELMARGLVGDDDRVLFRVTDDVGMAVREILGFFRNYHSIRYVEGRLVVRLRAAPTPEEIEQLNREFADMVVDGRIEASGPLPVEVAGGDRPDLPRLVAAFDRMSYGRLRAFIDALNALPSAPPLVEPPDVTATEAAATPPESGDGAPPARLHGDLQRLVARAADTRDEDRQQLAALQLWLLLERANRPGGGGDGGGDGGDRGGRGDGGEHEGLLPEPLRGLVLDDDQQRALLVELSKLVLTATSPQARIALLSAIGAGAPDLGLDLALDLLHQHAGELDAEETRQLLLAVDHQLARLEAAPPGPDRERARMDLVLNLQDPGQVLEPLASSPNRRVAAAARGVLRRLDAIGAATG
jgi:uncharacterized protein (TIGR00730 family)